MKRDNNQRLAYARLRIKVAIDRAVTVKTDADRQLALAKAKAWARLYLRLEALTVGICRNTQKFDD
jgi:hypothetical protein